MKTLPKTVKIALVDDHRVFLDGITMLVGRLSDTFEITGFNNPVECLESLEAGARFDLVICDLIMNAMNGLAFIAALRGHSKLTPVLVLSGINTSPPIDEIKQLGANGFVHKSVENNVLHGAIQALLAGGVYFVNGFGDIGETVIHSAETHIDTGGYKATEIPLLAKRQIEVLNLISVGATNKDISEKLDISENTVKTYLKQLFLKLGVNKRTACVRKAQSLGLI